ncbi:TonB-dependent receptor [Stenotrophobium rhamnosiphilum]|uniref:TonB-dependent receptor n=1 Tax=Stenotrophobium rhamnosiphilum TaxID=2029166 RepID=A0A2T5MD14_9GAMM|nr:TonB-dependent receptor [Stenotrophobium rhamnosiphilum]PTU30447.1 hypothetical protein CJD38_13065 [Stenotrophobium rhamnosiphilum]
MNKITIAATIAVAANFANFSTASAQETAATTSDDELTQLLGEVEAPAPSAPAASKPSEAAAAPASAAPAETAAAPAEAATDAAPVAAAAPASADSAAPSDTAAVAATPATDSTTPAAAAAPVDPTAASAETAALYDVIELPKKEKKVPVTPEPRRAGMIEEVIVTAQRREESLQEVPMSITVLDAKQMSNANITNASDLATYTPSMSTNQRFGADNATFSIRGFTQELRTTSSVATYMAEVVAPRGQSSQTSGDGAGPGALFDLANVQVLKGPQGTLFGRNTTGGAVLLTPNKPKDEFEGYVEVSGSQRNGMRAQGAVSIPVADTFKVRLAIDKNKRDGYLINTTKIGANELGSTDYTSVRVSSVWDITDNIQNYTIGSYITSDSTGYSSQLYGCNANFANDLSNFFLVFSGALQVPQCQAQLDRQKAAGQDGFYDVVSTIATPITAIKEKRLINTLTWDINDDIKLKNILAYAHLNTKNGSDIFGTQFPYALVGLPLDPDPNREFKTGVSVLNPNEPVTSQATLVGELQLQGTSFDSAVDWQAGLYYEKSSPDGFSGNNSAGLISCNMASLEGDGVIKKFDCYDALLGLVGGVLVQQYKTTYLNKAAYSQATWRINEAFSVTGGLRYTWDDTKGYGIKTRYGWVLGIPQAPTTVVTTPHVSSKAPTGLIEVDYKPFEGSMVYAKYLRGYRQGNVILAADPGVDTFKPEHVKTYEVGLKTEFAGPVPGRVSIAAFTNDFTDQQLQLGYISPGSLQTTTIVNAGKSRIRGIEGDAFFQVLDSITVGFAFSLLDTVLLEQADQTARVQAAGGPIAGASVTRIADVGDELPYAPKQTYVTNVSWRLPVSERLGEIDVGATYSMIGKQRSAATSSGPYGMLDAFNLLNLNFTWTKIMNTPLDLVVFGTNVLNEEYTTYTSGTYNLLGYESRAVGTPRLIGARLKVNFGAYQ